jgi:hypothetical protein
MKKLVTLSIVILGLLLPSDVAAHSDEQNKESEYIVTISHEPLSPFVGEQVTIAGKVVNKENQPQRNLTGKIAIKRLNIQEELKGGVTLVDKEIFRDVVTTDADGEFVLDYVFDVEARYDIEFIWGTDENQASGKVIQVRDASAFFSGDELVKRVGLFTVIAAVGFAAGAGVTFFLLTMTLHPKHKK